MRLGRMLLHCQSTVVYAIIDSIVQCLGRRRINHVLAERDVIGYNNFASWIKHYANEAARVVQVL